MGVQKYLAFQIGLVVFPNIVCQQRDRYNERNMTLSIVVDSLHQLPLLVSGNLFFEEPHHVEKDITVFPPSSLQSERIHEQALIPQPEVIQRMAFDPSNHFPHLPHVLGTMRHEEEFMPRVEFHEGPASGSWVQSLPPPLQNENCLDEILPQFDIMKPAVLFDGKQGEVFHEGTGEHADSPIGGHPLVRVHLHSFHSAAGRSLFEDEAVKIKLLQFSYSP